MRNPNAMTTWDTDETELWIDNDEYLYEQIVRRPGRTAHQIRVIIAGFMQESNAMKVDLSEVDWEYLADVFAEEDDE